MSPCGGAMNRGITKPHADASFRLLFPHQLIRVTLMAKPQKKKTVSKGKAMLLGVGLDSDGHKRLTTGSNFALVGGTKETHEEMTEKAIKINEKLASKGKQLHEVSREEFDEIAHSVGLQRGDSHQN